MRRAITRDRRWYVVAVLTSAAMALAGVLAVQSTASSAWMGAFGGAAAGLLAVLGLPSLPAAVPTVAVLGAGGVLVAHNANLLATDGWLLFMWAAALVMALVATERARHDGTPRLPGSPAPPRAFGEVVRLGGVAIAVAGVVALTLAPLVQGLVRPTSTSGEPPTRRGFEEAPSSLRANESLDMTTRPRLGDSVVLRISAPRKDFWRGEVFDVWDGRVWSRSDPRLFPTLVADGVATVVTEPLSGPAEADEWNQYVRVEAEYAEVVFGAPVVTSVDSPRRLLQRSDGSIVSTAPFGRGSAYTITSQRSAVTEEALRGSDPRTAPPEILARYAEPPVLSDRVAAIAEDVATRAATVYDEIRALEHWLAANTEYSLDAPLSPPGTDVVDHFVFESRLGWCQQISSTLAVMLRHLGIPARVAVGFVPGDYDPLAGEFVVRERDAHQWVEVYFPGVGWQGFDPTANVPLSGESHDQQTATGWLRENAVWIGALGVLLVGVVMAVRTARGLVRRRAQLRTRSWAAARMSELEALGAGVGRQRSPHETPHEYARALSTPLGDARSLDVGRAIERAAWSPHSLSPDEKSETEELIDQLSSTRRT